MSSHVIRDGVVAGTVGAMLGGVPSAVHALATGNDPLEASLAAGTIVLRHERRRSHLLPAAALVHGSIALLWGLVLAATLPRRRTILAGSLAGLAIAAVDLGLLGRRIPRIRSLPTGPQVADHLLFGACVGAVLAGRTAVCAQRVIPAPPSRVFDFLSDLPNHWRLEDCFAELATLENGTGTSPDGGTVRLIGPFGISRTARTRVISAAPPDAHHPGRLDGRAYIGPTTVGLVSWQILDHGAGSSRVVLSSALFEAAPIDRLLFTVGRAWLQHILSRVLANLAAAVA